MSHRNLAIAARLAAPITALALGLAACATPSTAPRATTTHSLTVHADDAPLPGTDSTSLSGYQNPGGK